LPVRPVMEFPRTAHRGHFTLRTGFRIAGGPADGSSVPGVPAGPSSNALTAESSPRPPPPTPSTNEATTPPACAGLDRHVHRSPPSRHPRPASQPHRPSPHGWSVSICAFLVFQLPGPSCLLITGDSPPNLPLYFFFAYPEIKRANLDRLIAPPRVIYNCFRAALRSLPAPPPPTPFQG